MRIKDLIWKSQIYDVACLALILLLNFFCHLFTHQIEYIRNALELFEKKGKKSDRVMPRHILFKVIDVSEPNKMNSSNENVNYN